MTVLNRGTSSEETTDLRSRNQMKLPRLYAILDVSLWPESSAFLLAAEELAAAGVTLLQYRNKQGNARQMLEHAQSLRNALGSSIKLIMNDRADLCLAAGFDGLHIGQDDTSPEAARLIIGPDRWLGISTHNPEQIAEADTTDADYLAIGPVFATTTKAMPVVGIWNATDARGSLPGVASASRPFNGAATGSTPEPRRRQRLARGFLMCPVQFV